VLELPPVLSKQWFNRGYYGTMSHNAKAIYQRYLGWYDANPANLNPLPPEPAAKKYVAAMGGPAAVMALAKTAIDAGDLRWAATLLNHVVFADVANTGAREQLAEVYTQLGYQSEAGTWRNIYLTGAQELRHGPFALPPAGFSPDVLTATTTTMLLDLASVRVNPDRAAGLGFKINIELTDRNETHLITVEHGVLIHEAGISDPAAGATVRLKRPNLLMTLIAGFPFQPGVDSGDIVIEGDAGLYAALVGLIEAPSPNFAVVTP
jgi:alkyl sulfatase BDS1-like metallo-beta-lactamase superfamily hydrolase